MGWVIKNLEHDWYWNSSSKSWNLNKQDATVFKDEASARRCLDTDLNGQGKIEATN